MYGQGGGGVPGGLLKRVGAGGNDLEGGRGGGRAEEAESDSEKSGDRGGRGVYRGRCKGKLRWNIADGAN